MSDKLHDTKMRNVYAHIYTEFYGLEQNALSHARNIIGKNLKEMDIQPAEIRKMNVFNIGPSREAVALHTLGAKAVYHFDISDIAVNSILKLKKQNGRFDNIYSRKTDICARQDLPIKEKIDLVYLAGVLHHLHDPAAALHNIFKTLSGRPKLFFRIYRSGSLAFFIVDFIRKFIGWEDKEGVTKIFWDKFDSMTEEASILYKDTYDDFFVPVLRLYDPDAVSRFFEAHHLKPITKQKFDKYDHGNTQGSGQGWSLCYSGKDFEYKGCLNMEFPGHVDQMEGIDYREQYILDTVKLMKRFLKACKGIPQQLKIDMALDLYKASQLYRIKTKVSAQAKHAEIQYMIGKII